MPSLAARIALRPAKAARGGDSNYDLFWVHLAARRRAGGGRATTVTGRLDATAVEMESGTGGASKPSSQRKGPQSAIDALNALQLCGLAAAAGSGELVTALAGSGVTTVEGVLTQSVQDLVRKAKSRHVNVSEDEVHDFVAKVSEAVVAAAVPLADAKRLRAPTALTLASDPGSYVRLSVGDPGLDQFLGGGLVPGTVVEVCGESATGKTQLVLQAALHVQLPVEVGGLDAHALYIGTEDAFPGARLAQLLEAYAVKYPFTRDVDMGANVFVESARSYDELWRLLTTTVPALMASRPLRLIVIDSIAGIFRNEYDWNTETVTRARDFFRVAQQLRWLAANLDVVVLVVNQVSDYFEPEDGSGAGPSRAGVRVRAMGKPAPDAIGMPGIPHPLVLNRSLPVSSYKRVQPALGLAWSACVTTRLVLTRRDTILPDPSAASGYAETILRELAVVFAPHLAPSSIRFRVEAAGLVADEG